VNETNTGIQAPSSARRILAFVLLPASYADPTWWDPRWLPTELFERLRPNPRSCRRLSAFLIRQAGLTAACLLEPDTPETRIALTPPAELDRSVFLAGLTLLSPIIARVLLGADRSKIKAAIGPGDYEFAIRRGRLLLQQARLNKVLPQASVADFAVLEKQCWALGTAALATALKNAPHPVVRRTQFKLRKGLVDGSWQPVAEQHDPFVKLFELLRPQVRPA